jgi:hypothetical protein
MSTIPRTPGGPAILSPWNPIYALILIAAILWGVVQMIVDAAK